MDAIKSMKSYYSCIIGNLIKSTEISDIIKFEIQLFVMTLSPIIIMAAFIGLLVGPAWDISSYHIVAFFVVMNFSAVISMIVVNADQKNAIIVNIISFLYMAALIITFIVFHDYLQMLFFFILTIISIFASLTHDRTLLNYLTMTYIITYLLSVTFFKTTDDSLFNIVLFWMIFFIVLVSYICNYLYRMVISEKLNQYIKIARTNSEISDLNTKLVKRERELQNKNFQLDQYNQEIIKKRNELEYLAYNDTLTGLPNRKMLLEKLDYLIESNQENKKSFAIAFLDLDNFKKVNDSLGHSVGDELLKTVARRLSIQIDKNDILGRVGGDEMVLLINRALSKEELTTYVQHLRRIIAGSYILSDNKFRVTVSIGLAIWPSDATTTEDLLKAADAAMYIAKDAGRNKVRFYQKGLNEELLKRIELEDKLNVALKKNEFYLVYQPLFEGGSKNLKGFEALIRWKTDDQTIISPLEFIPLAEEMGLIVEIGDWVIQQACRKIKEIKENYNQEVIIAVNISAIQILKENFVSRLIEIVSLEEVNPRNLEIEITETVFIADKEKVIKKLNELKSFGIKIAMDDFGTGYSSLSYLLNLPIDKLKIDKSFVDQINKDSQKTEVVGSIIEMSHHLDLAVVAEGVETQQQIEYLTSKKCDLLQGYYLSRPLSEIQMLEMMKS